MQILHITDGIFLSGNTQISNVRLAGRNNNTVKPLTEQVRRTADFGGQVKGDKITVENKRPVFGDNFIRQAFIGNHIQSTADFIGSLVKADIISLLAEFGRGCQTGRPGTDNGHLAPVGTNGFGFGRRVAIIFQDGRLNFRNINRKINPAAGAGFHTELIRANQTAGLPHRIIPGDGGDRLFKIAVFGMADKFLRAAIYRTGIHTGLIGTIETAVQFRL